MKKAAMILFAMMLINGIAYAKTVSTGHPALDDSLNTLTEQVGSGKEEFIKLNLAARFNQPADSLINLMKNDGLEVSEVFVVSYLAASQNKDVAAVASELKSNGHNWLQYLDSLGIKKGTREFKKLLKASINIHPKPYMPAKGPKSK